MSSVRVFFCLGICLLWISQAYAFDNFEIRHAQTSEVRGFYVLSADLNYVLHPEAKEMLGKGLAVKFVVQVELYQKRKYWRNKKIAVQEQVFYLQGNALTNKYILTSPNSSEQISYSSAQEAVRGIKDMLSLPLIEVSQIKNPKNVEARARLIVDVRHFSGTVNYLAKYWDDWRIVSEWYVWPLKL